MAATNVFSSLQREVEIVKEGLKNVDENIKKLTGRDPSEMSQRGPVGNRRVTLKRNFGDRITGPPSKRFNTAGAYHRLRFSSSNREQHAGQLESDGEEEEDDDHKPALQSTVVATPVPSRLKQDATPDKKTQTRNKRMFGVLLGTLQKFKETSSREAAQEKRRHEIEKKLEVAAEKEKEEVIRRKKELFYSRREKQSELENLEKQMEVAEMLDDWDAHNRQVNKFIKTKSKPHIYYLPAKHNDKTQNLLEETINAAEESIEERRKEVGNFLKKPVGEKMETHNNDAGATQGIEGDNEERVGDDKKKTGDDEGHERVDSKTGDDEGQPRVDSRAGEGDEGHLGVEKKVEEIIDDDERLEKTHDDDEEPLGIDSKTGDDEEHLGIESKTDDGQPGVYSKTGDKEVREGIETKTGDDEGHDNKTDDGEGHQEIDRKTGGDEGYANENAFKLGNDKDEAVKSSESNEKVEEMDGEQSGQMSNIIEQESGVAKDVEDNEMKQESVEPQPIRDNISQEEQFSNTEIKDMEDTAETQH